MNWRIFFHIKIALVTILSLFASTSFVPDFGICKWLRFFIALYSYRSTYYCISLLQNKCEKPKGCIEILKNSQSDSSPNILTFWVHQYYFCKLLIYFVYQKLSYEISSKLFDYKITFVNSTLENTNSKSWFCTQKSVWNVRFKDF